MGKLNVYHGLSLDKLRNPEFAKKYLLMYGICDKLLAEFGFGKNVTRYQIARATQERHKKELSSKL